MRQHEVRKMDESKNMTHSSERGPLCGPHAAAISAVLSEISIAADGGVVWQNPTRIWVIWEEVCQIQSESGWNLVGSGQNLAGSGPIWRAPT